MVRECFFPGKFEPCSRNSLRPRCLTDGLNTAPIVEIRSTTRQLWRSIRYAWRKLIHRGKGSEESAYILSGLVCLSGPDAVHVDSQQRRGCCQDCCQQIERTKSLDRANSTTSVAEFYVSAFYNVEQIYLQASETATRHIPALNAAEGDSLKNHVTERAGLARLKPIPCSLGLVSSLYSGYARQGIRYLVLC